LFFFIYAIIGSFALCCGSRKDTSKYRSKMNKCCGLIFGPRVWYIGALLFLLGGAAAAMSQVSQFKSTIDQTVSALDDFNNILGNTSGAVTDQLIPNLQALGTTLQNMKAASALFPAAQAAIQTMINNNNVALNSATQASNQLSQASSSLNSKIHDGENTDLNQLGNKVFVGGLASLGLFLAFLILTSFGLLSKPCAALYFRICNVILIITLLLVFIFAGLFVGVAVVTSDVCVAPSPAIVAIANLANPGADAVATLTYYTSCGNGSAVQPAGAYEMLLNGSRTLNTAAETAQQFEQQYPGPPFQAYYSELNAELNATNVTLVQVLDYISCTPVYSVYDRVLNALCSTGSVAVITVWALATAGSVLIFILVTSAARLCWRHPGDEVEKEEESLAQRVYGNGNTYLLTGNASSYAAPVAPAQEWQPRR
jgi:regulator of sigma D